jgi:hypothetical protein
MTEGWAALRGAAGILGALGASLVVLAGLTGLGQTEVIVPQPESEAELFFTAIAGHNYEAARHHLAEPLQQTINAEDLREMGEQLSDSVGGIEDAHGLEASEQAGTATALVSVKLGNGQEHQVSVPLEQEQGSWKITSLDPLLSLTAP